ncbi:MAG: TA system VapC family ribonuclease toxin [Fimbriimonadaceae bacterium]
MAATDLLDVNVWFALSAPEHPHHNRAAKFWRDESGSRVAFNSHTLLGLARVCSNAQLFGNSPLTVAEAWAVCLTWQADQAVIILPEPRRCWIEFNRFVAAGVVGKTGTSDAYLAAFAVSAGVRFVSFDAGFARYPGFQWLHLEA